MIAAKTCEKYNIFRLGQFQLVYIRRRHTTHTHTRTFIHMNMHKRHAYTYIKRTDKKSSTGCSHIHTHTHIHRHAQHGLTHRAAHAHRHIDAYTHTYTHTHKFLTLLLACVVNWLYFFNVVSFYFRSFIRSLVRPFSVRALISTFALMRHSHVRLYARSFRCVCECVCRICIKMGSQHRITRWQLAWSAAPRASANLSLAFSLILYICTCIGTFGYVCDCVCLFQWEHLLLLGLWAWSYQSAFCFIVLVFSILFYSRLWI